MSVRYEWTPAMGEISGFGGGYEAACRAMVKAGCEWLDAHPEAHPEFRGLKGVYGIIQETNDDAKALSDVVCAAAGQGATGAMHQATITACLWIKKNGWPAYVAEMSKPERRS